ncbi:hypothetical protein BGZ61DRAFT_187466 [Ilyonectria robusta]|uniref:uncharacterized protein n=1 Tax=Ilyonectria robusta TaxID=1079257 RepID=UPI001E8E1544|nr:uncharacterized protein BGZ61DRAFT_187466 [Ilyonectria robusta]KAH8729791.1 hypothetical protein BGZ61DRAFT_187466 [Ilyonectria robusta]
MKGPGASVKAQPQRVYGRSCSPSCRESCSVLPLSCSPAGACWQWSHARRENSVVRGAPLGWIFGAVVWRKPLSTCETDRRAKTGSAVSCYFVVISLGCICSLYFGGTAIAERTMTSRFVMISVPVLAGLIAR